MDNMKHTCIRCQKQTHSVSDIGLCESCASKWESKCRQELMQFSGLDEFRKAAEHILAGIEQMGFQLDELNFKDTPNRFARAYYEIFTGCLDTQSQIDEILSTTFPANGNNDMIVEHDIICFSMCPHHLLPVEYHVSVGYIPAKTGKVLGISKLGRLVKVLAKRPILQESFTRDIVQQLTKIGAQGAIAHVVGQHMCMRMRGANMPTSSVTTTALDGVFQNDFSAKQEFLESIRFHSKGGII